jgi:polysaccharide pyruvyl transferase WcaK-like protein
VLEPEVFNDNGFLDEKARKMYSSSLKKLVLTISGESDISEKVNLDVFREFCLRAVEAGYEVFLIPISYSSHTKDRFFLSEIEKINSEHVTYIKEEFRPEQLIGFLKKINVTISSRLHMCMYSTIVGTPFVSLKRNDKNSDLAQLFNMPCIEFDAVDAETLLNVVSRIVNDEASIRCKVLLQAQRYRKVHKEKAEELCSYINKI